MSRSIVSAATGETTVDTSYVPEVDLDELASVARATRTKLLLACDWTMVPDSPVNKIAWAEYRQALRDVTSQEGFPLEINWPVAPDT